MIYNGHTYTAGTIGRDFTFGVMWHTCPARELNVTKPEDVILAVNNAYRDMMPRTINGLGLSGLDQIPVKTVKNKEKNALRDRKAELLDELRMNLASNIITKVFLANSGVGIFNDTIHKELCEDFIKDFVAKATLLNTAIDSFNTIHKLPKNKIVATVQIARITYGKAQKIVNMTMKQLYCFDNAHRYRKTVFQFCHIPLDSVILDFFKLGNNFVWSNLNAADYDIAQRSCKQQWKDKTDAACISGDFTSLFFAEFIIWDAGSGGNGKKKENINSIIIK
ncbi:MAG: hypothetical protein IJX51_06990 [Clostridia bacterium]|nr:hypothetical protein [Clostridia bacterium]